MDIEVSNSCCLESSSDEDGEIRVTGRKRHNHFSSDSDSDMVAGPSKTLMNTIKTEDDSAPLQDATPVYSFKKSKIVKTEDDSVPLPHFQNITALM